MNRFHRSALKIARALWVLSHATHTVTWQPQHPLAAWSTKEVAGVGDSAIIGAGTYAKNNTCAVSATGHGELFIRANVAGRLSALIELAGLSLTDAANRIVHEELPEDAGGLIAVDRLGTIVLPFKSWGHVQRLHSKARIPSSKSGSPRCSSNVFIIHHELDSNVHHIELNNGSGNPINAQLIA